jgi:starvation-inducible DNA-binding protein
MDDLYPTRINIPDENIHNIVDKLNIDLANTMRAQMVIKFAHWNVKGDGFYPTHKLFDEIYEFMADTSDTIAERITALGGIAYGLPEQVETNNSGFIYPTSPSVRCRDHINAMADYISDIANSLREGIKVSGSNGDLVTQDVYIELTRGLDKFLYFLEASLRA